ncbi:hypothetical protein M0804_015541, partial [Polistes exclamans]
AVPRFDGYNISVSQFARACKRAHDSLPAHYTAVTENLLTRLLISKLNGNAYVVIENLKITKVESLIDRIKDAFLPKHGSNYYHGQLATEFKKPKEHVLDYFSRVRNITQSIIDEESKQIRRLERSVERKIEEKGLDAFVHWLPSDYRTALRFEQYTDFSSALICQLRIDKLIQEDTKRTASPTFRNRVANVRQIREIIICRYCKKQGHGENNCWLKTKSGRVSSRPSNSSLQSESVKRQEGSGVRRTLFPFSTTASENSAAKTGTVAIRQIKYEPIIKAPFVTGTSQELTGIVTLMIDTGAEINFIKVRIFGEDVKFHLVEENFPIQSDGIMGTELLQSRSATIDYTSRCLKFCKEIIPFVADESIRVPSGMSQICYCYVANTEVREEYIPRLQLPPGVYAGEALVKNENKKAYFKVINTTSKSVSLAIPRLKLFDYSTSTLPNVASNNSDPSSEVCDPDQSEYLHYVHTIFASPSSNKTPKMSAPKFEFSFAPSQAKSVKSLLHLEHFNTEEVESVSKMIAAYADIFHLPGEPQECTDILPHKIITSANIPVHTKQYRFPPVHKEEARKQTSELLKDEIIRLSLSLYNSPIWIVPKKTDYKGNPKWRIVIDYRNLNEKTVGDAYLIHNITEILDQLGAEKYFSTFNLKSGFYLIEMHSDVCEKTAFTTPYGHFEFSRMPFGLKNAPATFQRLMDHVWTGLQGEEMFVYLDDVVLYARALSKHKTKLDRLAHRLRKANLRLQPDKCEFLRRKVIYIGHIIGENGVKPDP